jgi:hypothetical protein
MTAPPPKRKNMVELEETVEDIAAILSADLGDQAEYDEPLSEESEARYSRCLEDYAEAHAEAEAGLQDLSAG